ncbi:MULTISPECIES: CHAT domain-containing protein [Bacillus]|uniref:CHAT domain-containing protein n=1 Tax=Bacillus TaxID=1386 RepID=UPI000771AC65|nr:CHAT domain-containing protein [Bacillus safensis]MCY1095483.1 CHAT domain-containing protein [Bacillus safensis]
MDISKINQFHLNYYVIFNAEKPSEEYLPITDRPFTKFYEGAIHGFDPELESVLPAIEYCLHLPRNGLDTLDLPPIVIEKGYEVPHSIILIPSYNLSEVVKSPMVVQYPPTLFISEDNFIESARKLTAGCETLLGHIKITDLSNESLSYHWETITKSMDKLDNNKKALNSKAKLLSCKAKSTIPLFYNANQLDAFDNIFESIKRNDFSKESVFFQTIQLNSHINAIAYFEKEKNYSPSEEEFLEVLYKQMSLASIPIIITLTGIANRHRPRNGKDNKLENTEKNVVDLLGIHRATARNGYWLDSGYLPKEIFIELNQLEKHCQEINISNKYVWNSMKRIGRILSSHLGEEGLKILSRASHITAFTDFPIGIAVLPGYDDPLCCIKSISYKSLTPLTRALQMELPRVGEIYIGKGFKVVIAECLLPDDPIKNVSDNAWKMAVEMLNSNQNVEVSYSEIGNVSELKKFLTENFDADILIISAHGYYDDKHNLSGLWIGSEVWFAADNEIVVPPIVILSACHVAPRGAGAVTVADLLHRNGAKAILGTLIPVNVFRNALLTIRLFVYICEALNGRGNFRTLSDAWKWVVSSNAVNEVLASSKTLQKWVQSKENGHSILEDFYLERSKGRLRTGFFYTDTISILGEMAKESGIENEFESLISSQGVFPESSFYIWSGSPENVILTEPIFEGFKKRFNL